MMKVIEKNDVVKAHYTGTLNDGSVFDSSKDRDPLEFKVGEGTLIPGFENGVLGMKVNEVKNINIPSDQAYGPVRQELVQEVSKDLLPKDMQVELGQTLVSQTPDGHKMNVVVKGITENTITIDANHPLAGQDLNFEITIVEIN